jgi:hypothetical protein
MTNRFRVLDLFNRKKVDSKYLVGDFVIGFSNYYYVVEGDVPQHIAEELYENPIGKADIRVSGNCACPAPSDFWLDYKSDDGKIVIDDQKEKNQFAELIKKGFFTQADIDSKYLFVDDKTKYPAFVTSYHIDSELGLYIFLTTLKNYGYI